MPFYPPSRVLSVKCVFYNKCHHHQRFLKNVFIPDLADR